MEYLHKIYQNGTLISVEDTRTVEGERSRRLESLKELYSVIINDAYPIYKQTNAALGLLDPVEAEELRVGLQKLRMEYEKRKDALSTATSLAALDAIYDTSEDIAVSLDKAKQAKIEEVRTVQSAKESFSTFTHNGHTFAFTKVVAQKAAALRALISSVDGTLPLLNDSKYQFPQGFSWLDVEQNAVQMDQEAFVAFVKTMANHQLTIEMTARMKVAAIEALTTVEDVENFDPSF